MDEIHLSQYGEASVEPAPVSRMMAEFAADFRDDVDINLGVGYVNEQTIPRDFIAESLRVVVDNPGKYRQALNYGGPQGSDNLISSVKRFLVENNIGTLTTEVLDKNEILIASNGATSLLESIAQILPKGTVITSDPIYYIYSNFLQRCGYEIVAVPEDNEGIRTELLEQSLDDLGDRKKDISFIYLVTVNNPTSSILAPDRQKQVIEIACRLSEQLGRKVPVILDKAYENLIHDPVAPKLTSALVYDELGIVYEIYTLSKIIAPALRIGYMIGPASDFTRAIIQRTSDIGFSAAVMCQEMASVILDTHTAEQIQAINAGYRHKALKTKKWIDEFLGKYISECRGGQAAFYYYLTFEEIETHENSAFFKFLTRTTGNAKIDGPPGNKNPRVIYIPGQLCVHPKGSLTGIGKRQLRLSYGFEEIEKIRTAIQLMQKAAQYSLEK